MEEERPAAQEPGEQHHRGGNAERQARRLRQEHERERGQHRREQQQALLSPGDPGAAEERRERETEPDEAAHEREAAHQPGRRGHRALVHRTVTSRERPEALARDHDAVRARHPTEARQVRGLVGAEEDSESAGAIHFDRIAPQRPPGKGRAA